MKQAFADFSLLVKWTQPHTAR